LAFAFVGLMLAGPANATSIYSTGDVFMPQAVVTVGDEPSQAFALTPVFANGAPGVLAAKQDNERVIGFELASPQPPLFFDGGIVTGIIITGTFEPTNDVVRDNPTGKNVSALLGPTANALDPPTITAVIGFDDLGDASSFDVNIVSLLNPPLNGQGLSVLSINGTFLDGGNDGGSASPLLPAPPPEQDKGIAQATVEGGPVAIAGPEVFFPPPPPGEDPSTQAYPMDETTTLINCANFGGTCDSYDLLISFMGSGGDDRYTFTATHSIDIASAVPEPTALSLLGIGLIGLVWLGRKKLS
jgi:hypothetical protein